MEIPAPVAGVVEELLVAVGDTVSEGTAIVRLAAEGAAPEPRSPTRRRPRTPEDARETEATVPQSTGAP